MDVLFEKPGQQSGQVVGRSPYLQPVPVMAPSSMIGEIHRVIITEASANSLFGELQTGPVRASATDLKFPTAVADGALANR